MSNQKQLGALLLGTVLCGGAWAVQSGSSTVTITSPDGKRSIVERIDPSAVAAYLSGATAEYYRSLGWGINVAGQGRGLGTGSAAAGGGNRWNLWAAASYNRVGSSFQPLQTSGNIGVLSAGLDYRVNDNFLVGAALAGERSRTSLNYVAGGGSLSGDGLTLAPYLAYVFNRSWALDATIGYGRSTYDISGGGATGSFRGTRTFGNLGLNYNQQIAGSRWQVTGRGSLLTLSSRSGSFTDSTGAFSDSTSSDLTQLRLGGQMAYAAGQVTPYFGLTYVYDVRRPGSVAVGGQTSSGDRDSWVPAIGLRFSTGGSVYGGLQLSSERGRSEVKNDQLLFNLGVRF